MSLNKSRIKQLVLDIMTLAIEKTETTKADVFVNYGAHVNLFEIRINPTGWINSSERADDFEEIKKDVYLDQDEEIVIEKLENMLQSIERL